MVKYERQCLICGREFTTKYERQDACSFVCRQEKQRRYAQYYMRRYRHPSIIKHKRKSTFVNNTKEDKACIICGFNLTTDGHHESGIVHILCPNHHALITRNIKTFEDLIKERLV